MIMKLINALGHAKSVKFLVCQGKYLFVNMGIFFLLTCSQVKRIMNAYYGKNQIYSFIFIKPKLRHLLIKSLYLVMHGLRRKSIFLEFTKEMHLQLLSDQRKTVGNISKSTQFSIRIILCWKK